MISSENATAVTRTSRAVTSGTMRLMSHMPHLTIGSAEEHAAALIEAGATAVTIRTARRQKLVEGDSEDLDDRWIDAPGQWFWVWAPLDYAGPNPKWTTDTAAKFEAVGNDRVRKCDEARELIAASGLPMPAGEIRLGFLSDQQIDTYSADQIAAAYRDRYAVSAQPT